MSSAVPSDFVDLYTASTKPNSQTNIIGVVTDFLPPSRSRGPDWICTFSIADSSLGGTCDEGLKVRFFKPVAIDLPRIQGTGDVVLLKDIKITLWSGMTMAISSRYSTWAVFPASSIPETVPAHPIQLSHARDPRAIVPSSPEMMHYVIRLCNSRDRSSFTTPVVASLSNPQPSSSAIPTTGSGLQAATGTWPNAHGKRGKFSLIKDLQIDVFYDLVGQVVKMYPTNGCVELYLTDYTPNSLLYNYEWGQDDGEGVPRDGDEYNYAPRASTNKKWPGPFGKMTLTVTLWPSHSYFAQSNVRENDFVHLRNVRAKWSKDAKMEGSMHTDRYHPDRVDVTILKDHRDDDRVKNVLRRKLEYTKRFEAQSQSFVKEVRNQKRKQADGEKPLSRYQARQKRKQEAEQEDEKPAQQQENEKKKTRRREARKDRHETLETSPPPRKAPKQELNKNIRCSHHTVPSRPLTSILSLSTHALTTPAGTLYTLPFQNIKSRATVRVVDFFPADLADFAIRLPKSSEYDVLSDREDSENSEDTNETDKDSEADNIDRRWDWRFGLVLEEAGSGGSKREVKTRMNVYVADQDADFLLKMDAENLRTNPQALASLREKLFLLWGDLHERKIAQASNLTSRNKVLIPVDANQQSKSNKEHQDAKEEPKSMAFQCCLKEYGVRVRAKKGLEEEGGDEGDSGDKEGKEKGLQGWERKWRMFGVTIV